MHYQHYRITLALLLILFLQPIYAAEGKFFQIFNLVTNQAEVQITQEDEATCQALLTAAQQSGDPFSRTYRCVAESAESYLPFFSDAGVTKVEAQSMSECLGVVMPNLIKQYGSYPKEKACKQKTSVAIDPKVEEERKVIGLFCDTFLRLDYQNKLKKEKTELALKRVQGESEVNARSRAKRLGDINDRLYLANSDFYLKCKVKTSCFFRGSSADICKNAENEKEQAKTSLNKAIQDLENYSGP